MLPRRTRATLSIIACSAIVCPIAHAAPVNTEALDALCARVDDAVSSEQAEQITGHLAAYLMSIAQRDFSAYEEGCNHLGFILIPGLEEEGALERLELGYPADEVRSTRDFLNRSWSQAGDFVVGILTDQARVIEDQPARVVDLDLELQRCFEGGRVSISSFFTNPDGATEQWLRAGKAIDGQPRRDGSIFDFVTIYLPLQTTSGEHLLVLTYLWIPNAGQWAPYRLTLAGVGGDAPMLFW